MAPLSRTVFYIERAHYLFWGYGIPWDIIVDYNATTAFPDFRAKETGSDNFKILEQILCIFFINIINWFKFNKDSKGYWNLLKIFLLILIEC